MKKRKLILPSLALAMTLSTVPVFASQPLTIQINGSVTSTPSGVHVVKDQVMLPLRWACEQLGARSIEWDAKFKTVSIEINETYDAFAKLSSYVRALTPRDQEKETEMWPLSEKAKKIPLPRLSDRAVTLNFPEQHIEPKNSITILVNGSPYAAYSAEIHNGRVYVLSDWIQELFNADVTYDQKTNTLSIQAPDREEIEKQIRTIEEALIPATPEEALKLWGRGEQTRSGALQYAALSPELREKAMEQVKDRGWVTGGSSPWVGPITVKEEKKLSNTTVQYTVTYPEITSDRSATGTETFIVEKRTVNEKEGWFITKLLFANPYYTIIPAESQPPEEPITYVPLPN
ncbi:copper amine oxidase N-terminal domain-containing protein [Aneurinibacillus migulanus]|uniref:copper amine oxidase N-terminal domain-containing protein n=1 Tax=Aneurinibacillus migulanus TaxID=47500 RepID=UPI000698C3FC|nr:copper amine oxidase N-terminal domain-containing protein [Aneurinibacillus migulanus]CEH28321.1 Copper amine oxidase domain protein [Aneurinibacillus migulanus]